MEDNFDQNDFEEFLKEQVRNHRIYPTDTVWRDINKKLHGDKKWPALTIAAFTLLSATIAICVHFTPQPDIFSIKSANNDPKNTTLLHSQKNIDLNNFTSASPLYKEKYVSDEKDKNQLSQTATVSSDIASVNSSNRIISTAEREAKVIALQPINNTIEESPIGPEITDNASKLSTTKEAVENTENPALRIIHPKIITSKEIDPLKSQHTVKEYEDKNMADDFLKDHKNDISLYTASKYKTLKHKFSFQIYLAPSISYRKLLEDRSVLKEGSNTGPVGLNYVADVNNVVRHKPGNGLEAGVSIMYNLTDNFRIKSGFQFNVRQYSIEAYRSNTELSSIALIGNNRIDTVNTLAIYRNRNGYYSAELVNRYYQLAIPIGVEWEIIGNKRIQLNVAGSIQPTYLINRNAYILSTNFKNYSENPGIVRSFNINSNIETFISFKAGYFKWQVGPQLRYQPYSTFISRYPIKEHLLDYGIKIGLSKTFN